MSSAWNGDQATQGHINQQPTGKAEVMLNLTRRIYSGIRSCKELECFLTTKTACPSVCSFQVFRVQTFFALPVMATARRCLQQIFHQ